jgi:hypothetical protein
MKFLRKAHAVVVLLLVLLSFGCASHQMDAAAAGPSGGMAGYPAQTIATPADAPMREESGTTADMDMDGAKDSYAKQPAPEPAPVPGKGKPQPGQGQQGAGADSKRSPILIYTADYTMSVFEVVKSLDAVEALAKSAGGYLARRDDRSITVRVPAEKFQDVIGGVEKVGDVLHRNVVSEDVTAEYRDLEIQLQNHLALRARMEKLLEKANKVEEALQIERELGRITGEIERVKGRLKLLTDLAQFSTITVTFAPRANETVQEGPFVLPLPWLSSLGLNPLMNLR